MPDWRATVHSYTQAHIYIARVAIPLEIGRIASVEARERFWQRHCRHRDDTDKCIHTHSSLYSEKEKNAMRLKQLH